MRALEEIAIDLSRPDDEIHRDLRARFPGAIDLNWELEEGDRVGIVYNGNRKIARLIHTKEPGQ